MEIRKGDVIISVEQIDGFGKNPGLWIGTEKPNMRVKVASFGSKDKAEQFCRWLSWMVGYGNREEVKFE